MSTVFRTVIVGYEDTPQGRDAFALGQLLAMIAEAPLRVAFVSPRERRLPGMERRQKARRASERLISQISPAPWSSGLAIEGHGLEGGSVAEALAAFAEQESAGLIVLGSNHRGPIGRVLVGGVAEQLLHGGPCSVAVANRGFSREVRGRSFDELRLRVIAAAFDGGREAEAALRLAADLGLRCHAAVRVIAAIDSVQRTPYLGPIPAAPEPDLRERLDSAVAALPPELRPVAVCDRGKPAQVLLDHLGRGVNLALLGSRGAGRLGRVYLGSVAAEVMQEAPCPVLVTPRSASPAGAP